MNVKQCAMMSQEPIVLTLLVATSANALQDLLEMELTVLVRTYMHIRRYV